MKISQRQYCAEQPQRGPFILENKAPHCSATRKAAFPHVDWHAAAVGAHIDVNMILYLALLDVENHCSVLYCSNVDRLTMCKLDVDGLADDRAATIKGAMKAVVLASRKQHVRAMKNLDMMNIVVFGR